RHATVSYTLRVCGRKKLPFAEYSVVNLLLLGPFGPRWLTSLARGPKAPLRSFAEVRRLAAPLPITDPRCEAPGVWLFGPGAEHRVTKTVENTGLEPVTSWLQTRRSPS